MIRAAATLRASLVSTRLTPVYSSRMVLPLSPQRYFSDSTSASTNSSNNSSNSSNSKSGKDEQQPQQQPQILPIFQARSLRGVLFIKAVSYSAAATGIMASLGLLTVPGQLENALASYSGETLMGAAMALGSVGSSALVTLLFRPYVTRVYVHRVAGPSNEDRPQLFRKPKGVLSKMGTAWEAKLPTNVKPRVTKISHTVHTDYTDLPGLKKTASVGADNGDDAFTKQTYWVDTTRKQKGVIDHKVFAALINTINRQ
ncbi:hypothetical protein GQ42DRAFT_177556 [Ramicandelaber brevisporus]|nr:hypothetical protein GQ42DRAFT_177556 [Ramicandelaber brevisporus]